MKSKSIISILLIFTLFLGLVVPVIGGGDHDHSQMNEHAAPDHCDDVTESLKIEAPESGSLDYDKDEYHVQKNTCYKFVFHNKAKIDHDVNLEHHEDHGMDEVHLHAANNTAGEHNNGTTTMNVMTPDEDTELTLYCSVQGHRSSGMEATLIVGDTNSFLPFNWAFFMLGLFTITGIAIKGRKSEHK